MDDDFYITHSGSTINGNSNFYKSNISMCPSNIKYYTKFKYEPKFLVWVAFSVKGISKILIRPSGFAINLKTNLEDCIKARLMPFIQ